MSIEARAAAAGGAALLAALLFTPVCQRAARARGILAHPTGRGVHREPIPYLGGLAILGGVVIGAVFCPYSMKLVGLLLAAVTVTVIGVLDDVRDLSPLAKLLLTMAAAAVLIPLDVVVQGINVPGFGFVYLGPWARLLTLLWVVFMIHATNFIDGMDGEAAGISAIAAAAFVVLALLWLRRPQDPDVVADMSMVAVLSSAVVGASLGFLRYNFNPARIFMGDAGALLLGLLLAGLSIVGLFKTVLLCVAPVIILGLQVFDTVWAVVRRTAAGQPAYRPDRGHIHHRLLDAGLSHRQAVLILYAIAACLAGLAVFVGAPR